MSSYEFNCYATYSSATGCENLKTKGTLVPLNVKNGAKAHSKINNLNPRLKSRGK
jgi:hypothetical protein